MIHLLKHLLTVKSDQLHVPMPTDYNVEECMKRQMKPTKNPKQGLKNTDELNYYQITSPL